MKGIMIQGTASSVGKSLIATVLCRLFYEEGFLVAPFKAQNVTHHFYINTNGEKIAKSQAIQARAANTEPSVLMNPTSLAFGSCQSEVNVFGKPDGAFSRNSKSVYEGWITAIQSSLHQLEKQYDLLVLEGAGSPVELNLKERDVSNMKTAELADVPVLLVADIQKGGVFASIAGTLALLEPEEMERVKGIIINKFHGDKAQFQDGISLIEQISQLPVLGVLPHTVHCMKEEDDTVLLADNSQANTSNLPTDEEIDHLTQKMKRHLNWDRILEIAEQWDKQ